MDDEMHVSVVRFADGRAFVGDVESVLETLRSEVGPPCALCFGTGYIETDGIDEPREIECPACGGDGGAPKPPVPVYDPADLIV